MREKDPNSRGNRGSKDPAGEPLTGTDPRIGIPDDDDDPFKGSIIEEQEPDPSHAVETAADESELDFTGIAAWYDILPWREWLAGPQRGVSQLVAEELSALASSRTR